MGIRDEQKARVEIQIPSYHGKKEWEQTTHEWFVAYIDEFDWEMAASDYVEALHTDLEFYEGALEVRLRLAGQDKVHVVIVTAEPSIDFSGEYQ